MDLLSSLIVVGVLCAVGEWVGAEFTSQSKEPDKHKRSLVVLQCILICLVIAAGVIVRFARIEGYRI